MQTKTRQLWGQQFDMVDRGLDEGQVSEFVNDLVGKYQALAEQQQHFLSLGVLSEKTALEASKLAEDIRSRAKKEAQEDSDRAIGQAKRKAAEILAQGRRAAEEANQREIENIIRAARRKAAIIETDAKQQAQVFLIKSREVIESDLKGEVRDSYDRLITYVQDFIEAGNEVETKWKGKRLELWTKETYGIEGYEKLNSLLEVEAAKPTPIIGFDGDSDTGIPEGKVEVAATAPREDAAKGLVHETAGAAVDTREVKESEAAVEALPEAKAQAEPQVEAEVPVQAAAQPEEQEQAPTEAEAEEAAQPKAQAEAPAKKAAKKQKEEQAPAGAEVQAEVMVVEETAGHDGDQKAAEPVTALEEHKVAHAAEGEMEGEVDMELMAPIDLAVMSKIYAQLQTVPEIKILRTVGSYEKGSTMTLLLEKPIALVEMLSSIPRVKVQSESPHKWRFLRKSRRGGDGDSGKAKLSVKTRG